MLPMMPDRTRAEDVVEVLPLERIIGVEMLVVSTNPVSSVLEQATAVGTHGTTGYIYYYCSVHDPPLPVT